MARDYGGGNPRNIVNGLLVRRLYTSVRPTLILESIVRILTDNQTAELAVQTTLDGWSSSPLTIIPISPNNRWHIGTGKDFNDLACNLIYTSREDDQGNGILFTTLEISLIVTVETGTDAFIAYKRADSYLSCFKDILHTYFLLAPAELLYIPATTSYLQTASIETAEIEGRGIVNQTALLPNIKKEIGYLPTLRLKIVYQSTTNSF